MIAFDDAAQRRRTDDLYVQRLAWKFGALFSGADTLCRVCGSAKRDHIGDVPAIYCPTSERLVTSPEVPAALERAVIVHASAGKVDAYQRPDPRTSHYGERRRVA